MTISIASLAVFIGSIAAMILLVVRPLKVPMPWPRRVEEGRRGCCGLAWSLQPVELGFETPPLLGVALLLALRVITPADVVAGVVGNATIQPYSVLVLFLSLAYVCVALDQTGLFAYVALRIAKAAGSSGRRLFVYYFVLSSFVTLFTSNDIVILTLSPIVFYFCKITKSDPIPFLVAEFYAANLWSSILYTGNPTNIIVAQAFNMQFLPFSYWTGLPTIGSGLAVLAALFVVFRDRIPRHLVQPELDADSMLIDKSGAVFGAIVLVSTLLLLALSPLFNASLWSLSLSAAGVVLLRNFVVFVILKREMYALNTSEPTIGANLELPNDPLLRADIAVANFGESEEIGQPKPVGERLTFLSAILAMPWRCAPFILGMFILVAALRNTGWTHLIAAALASIIGDSILMCILVMSAVGIVACNILSNQPMAILLTEVMLSQAFTSAVPSKVLSAANFSVIIASNIGPNFTLIGALAGIVWSKILGDKGLKITYFQFVGYAVVTQLPALVVSCALLWLSSLFA